MRTVVLSKEKHRAFIESVLPVAKVIERFDFDEILNHPPHCLLSYMSGVIVPQHVLDRVNVAVNFHPATPAYLGRDPHHWACYDASRWYGATVHWMVAKVDAGPIIDVQIASAFGSTTPERYKQIGDNCCRALFAQWAPKLARHPTWTGTKRSRADLIGACDMQFCSTDEISKRSRAFAGFEHKFKLPLMTGT